MSDLPPELADAIITMATELLRDVDRAVLDADADKAAYDAAALLAPSFLRDGYFRLHRALLRALERHLGRVWVSDYLEAITAERVAQIDAVEVVDADAHEERAWSVLKEQLSPRRRPRDRFARERVEEAVGN